jgi:hypothetical protein
MHKGPVPKLRHEIGLTGRTEANPRLVLTDRRHFFTIGFVKPEPGSSVKRINCHGWPWNI